MKLIDAEVRVTVRSYDIEHEKYEHIEMSVSDALDFATDEGCPPTIDAIPVEWISAYMNKSYGRVRAEIIREMLDAWMEQEAR